MTYADKNGNKITVTRKFNPKTGNLDFFTDVAAGTDQLLLDACEKQSVNLSRGRNRMYTLLNLSTHNGSGACWTDGQEIHTAARQAAYEERTTKDITAALKAAAADFVKAQENKRFDTAVVTIGSI